MYLFPHSESWSPAYWTDSSYPECCSEPDSTAKFPESKASELFRASVNPEWSQALSASVLSQQCQEQGSLCLAWAKPYPAVRFRAELSLASESIPEC